MVFCTAYDAHALSAFEAAAVDYLVKPVRPERLHAALERARTFTAGRDRKAGDGDTHGKRRTHLCARLRGSLRLIPIEDVHYLQAEEKYVVVHHARGEDLIEESLKSLEEEFGDRFLRIHRNCLVARHEILELKRGTDGRVHAVLRHGKTAAGGQPALRGAVAGYGEAPVGAPLRRDALRDVTKSIAPKRRSYKSTCSATRFRVAESRRTA